MSERRPKLMSRVAVTRLYPISTKIRYWNEVRWVYIDAIKDREATR